MSEERKTVRLTKAQRQALKMVEKRDWPGGEPRESWIHAATMRRLLADDLVVKRAGSESPFSQSLVLDLTDLGRAALQENSDGG